MANRKISDLTALTAPATGDLLPIVDISEAAAADKNKKITYGELLASAPAGSAAAPSFSFDSDPNTGIYSPAADTLAFAEGGVEVLRITAAGLVGVGTSAPDYQLHATTSFAVGAAGFNQQLSFTNDTIQSLVLGSGYTPLKLNPLGGNVGIGTTSPDAALTVVGTGKFTAFQVNGDRIRVGTAKTPASATDTGTTGEICWDTSYVYVCTATNTWKRSAISTW
jgi:hypothetical protein